MSATLSRRAALAGAVASAAMVGAAVVAAAPVLAVAQSSKVEAAFAEWKAARQAINACPDDSMEPASHPIWARLNEAERIIRETDEYGPRIAEIRLWVSLTGDLIYTGENEAIEREDVDWLLANADEPEWSTVLALHSIRALRGVA